MQRLIIRLSAVGALLTVGVAAIVQAQFRTNSVAAVTNQQPADQGSPAPATGVPQPIPGVPEDDATPLVAPTADAFRTTTPPQPAPFRALPAENETASSNTETGATRFIETPRYGSSFSEPTGPGEQGDGGQEYGGQEYGGQGGVRPAAGEVPATDEPTAPPDPNNYAVQPPSGGAVYGIPVPGETVPSPAAYADPVEPEGSLAADPSSSAPGSMPAAEPEYAGGQYAGGQYAGGQYAASDTDARPAQPPSDPAATVAASPYAFSDSSPVGGASQARLAPNVPPPDDRGEAYAPPAPQAYGIAGEPADDGTVDNVADSAVAVGSSNGSDYGAAADEVAPSAYSAVGAPAEPPGEPPGEPGIEGSGTPGDRKLDGPQTPTLTIEKVAPPEIQVNRPATFQIRVRNVGRTAAHQVILVDEVPRGTRMVQATPAAARSPDGALTWQLGTLEPGQEAVIAIELLPLREGEVGSVAQVSFQAEVSARTICTQPKLKLKHSTQPSILIGDRVTMSITMVNEGSGAATGVVIQEDVPEGLTHAAGRELEYEVGTLQPGETKNLELTLRADKPGTIQNRLVVRADGDITVQDQIEINIVAPQLKVGVEGPQQRYLERQATYVVSVANDGTANAQDVEVTAHLPRGFKFVSTNNHGRYDPQAHAVLWSLAELPAAAKGSVELTVLPVEMGQHKLRIQGSGAMNLADSHEHPIAVEGLAALFFQVGDVNDPIPVGSETVYELRVSNTGSKAATNIRLSAILPVEMKPLSGEGPTRVLVEGQQIAADPIPRLAPRGEAVYKFRVRGLQPGDQRIRVQMTSDELQAPVLKEESTQVYSDR